MWNRTSSLTTALLLIGQGAGAQSLYGQCGGSSWGAFSVGSEVEVVYDITYSGTTAHLQSVVIGRAVMGPGLDILPRDAVKKVTARDGTILRQELVPVRYDSERKLLLLHEDSVSLGDHNVLLLDGTGGTERVATVLTIDPELGAPEPICNLESKDLRQRLLQLLIAVPEIDAFLGKLPEHLQGAGSEGR